MFSGGTVAILFYECLQLCRYLCPGHTLDPVSGERNGRNKPYFFTSFGDIRSREDVENAHGIRIDTIILSGMRTHNREDQKKLKEPGVMTI